MATPIQRLFHRAEKNKLLQEWVVWFSMDKSERCCYANKLFPRVLRILGNQKPQLPFQAKQEITQLFYE